MHEPVGQFAAAGEYQQSLSVEIEPADVHPASASDARQPVEHAGPPLRIVARDDFPFLLVVDEHARRTGSEFKVDRLAVHPHPVLRADALADMGRQTVDADTSGDDPILQLAPRTEASLRQHLVQLLRLGLDNVALRLPASSAGARLALARDAGRSAFLLSRRGSVAVMTIAARLTAARFRLGSDGRAKGATLARHRPDPSPVRFP
jgi:hypothetical protein